MNKKAGVIPRYAVRRGTRHLNGGTDSWPLPLCGSGGTWRVSTSAETEARKLCGWCVQRFEALKTAMEDE